MRTIVRLAPRCRLLYVSRLQRSGSVVVPNLGLRPRLLWDGPLALKARTNCGYGGWSELPKNVPRGLKPHCLGRPYGTGKPVPLSETNFCGTAEAMPLSEATQIPFGNDKQRGFATDCELGYSL